MLRVHVRGVTFQREGRDFRVPIHSGHHVSLERGKEASFSSQQRKSKDQITRCCGRKHSALRRGRGCDHPDNRYTLGEREGGGAYLGTRGVGSIHRNKTSQAKFISSPVFYRTLAFQDVIRSTYKHLWSRSKVTETRTN